MSATLGITLACVGCLFFWVFWLKNTFSRHILTKGRVVVTNEADFESARNFLCRKSIYTLLQADKRSETYAVALVDGGVIKQCLVASLPMSLHEYRGKTAKKKFEESGKH